MTKLESVTTSKRIRTVYFWTKKQLDEARRSAMKLAIYFAGGEATNVRKN